MMPSAVPRRLPSISLGTISTIGTYTEADVPAATARQAVSTTVLEVRPTPTRHRVHSTAEPTTTTAPLNRWLSQVAPKAKTMNRNCPMPVIRPAVA